ncbi:MAG TPA: kynureninase, partial [Thermoanaerobaculia bacterium]|nr:kynureninase [Thermoanaerobaculia bacterium]
PAVLRTVSQHQVALLAERFDALDLPPERVRRDRSQPLERLGGFLALQAPDAPELARRLGAAGVRVDARGELLRLGPAPYLSDAQLVEAVAILGEVASR